jgi:hypothetical protein
VAKLCAVLAELAKLEAAAAVHLADFERESERCERLMAEVPKTTADLMERKASARLACEFEPFQARRIAHSGDQASSASARDVF